MCWCWLCEYMRSSWGSGCLSEHNVTAAEQWLKSVNYAAWQGAKPIPDFSSFQYVNHALNCVLFLWFTSSLCFQSNRMRTQIFESGYKYG